MQVKIDTKEKFHVITLMQPFITANIAAELSQVVTKMLHQEIRNVVLKLSDSTAIEDAAAAELARVQQYFYDYSASFVICELQPPVEERLEALDLLEVMNVTPTESEAGDIVQMEEIERELLDEEQ